MILSFVVSLAIAWFVIKPLVVAEQAYQGVSAQSRSLIDQKERCLQVLEDLELDCRTEKIKPADYTRMKAKLMSEIEQIQEKIDGRI